MVPERPSSADFWRITAMIIKRADAQHLLGRKHPLFARAEI
jgi:hypothetical protein